MTVRAKSIREGHASKSALLPQQQQSKNGKERASAKPYLEAALVVLVRRDDGVHETNRTATADLEVALGLEVGQGALLEYQIAFLPTMQVIGPFV